MWQCILRWASYSGPALASSTPAKQRSIGLTSMEALAIDFDTSRLYWTDWLLRTIYRCDFNGNAIELMIEFSGIMTFPFALAVQRDNIYWSDDNRNAVYRVVVRKQSHIPIQISNAFTNGILTIDNSKVHDIQLVPCSILTSLHSYTITNFTTNSEPEEPSVEPVSIQPTAVNIANTPSKESKAQNNSYTLMWICFVFVALIMTISIGFNVYFVSQRLQRKNSGDEITESLVYFSDQDQHNG